MPPAEELRQRLPRPPGLRWFIARSAWLASLLGTIVCLLPAGTSLAVTPLRGAAYAGGAFDDDTEPLTQASARLVVSRSGRTLVPRRGSFVAAHAPCGRDESVMGAGAKVRLTERFPIRADGSFRFVERRGDTTLWGHGRFTRRWAARLFVVLRTPPTEPRNHAHPGFCTVRAPGALRLSHYGEVPFRDCRTHPAATVAESADARVFAHRLGNGFYGPTRWYGCLFNVNRQVLIGSTSEEGIGGPTVFRLAGPYAGYVRVGCTAGCGYHVEIKDLRDGSERPGACCWLGVFDLVINANATFAFIEDPPGDPPPEVRVKDGDVGTIFGVPTRMLDSGAGIDNTSLELKGNTLSWLHDGAVRTAPLE